MKSEDLPLFRTEVTRRRSDRLHGSISLATPLSWQVISALLLSTLITAGVFLTNATYARVETAPGSVTLDKGVTTIVPSRAGVITVLAVTEGQHVHAGQVLARIRSEEDMTGGATVPARIRAALGAQDGRLAAQSNLLLQAAEAEQARLREQIAGLSAELVSLGDQIADQHRLLEVATGEYDDVQRVAEKGYISRRDLEARQTTVLSRRQQLSQLEQLRASKVAAIAETRRTIVQSGASARAQIASAESERAALTQQLAQADLSSGYTITSPISGIVTAMIARPGQAATIQYPLMMIVPQNATSRVELYVPTSAAGFLRAGQEVRLAIDAYPYQQFGTIKAYITDISATTITRQEANGSVPVYLVTARLPHPWLMAFGRRQTLLPGMTLVARIIAEKRTLVEWLFEPLFAVGNR